MGSDIQDIWIMQENGRVLFTHTLIERIDSQLFGGFLSALNSLAATFSKDGLHNFEMGDLRFFLMKHNDLIFIANTKKHVKPQKVENDIKENITKFIKKYPDDLLKKWNGDLNFFKDFKVEIEDTLDNPLKKLKDSLW